MKDFNKGFTLGEVLICMAIVGVIAALSLPIVATFKEKTVIGATLGKSVLTLQNGFSNIIQRTQDISNDDTPITTLDGIQLKNIFSEVPSDLNGDDYLIDSDYLFSKTGGLIGTEPANDYDIGTIKDYNGNNIDILSKSAHAYRLLKINSIIIFEEIAESEGTNGDDEKTTETNAGNEGILTRILIDANGIKKPNCLGKDIFLFGLANNGRLIPAGSEEFEDFDSNVKTNSCTKDNPGKGIACAAKVMQDKWKIEY